MGFAQTFLIFLHLHQHFLWDKYEEDKKSDVNIEPPPSVFVKVQGKPGTGKHLLQRLYKISHVISFNLMIVMEEVRQQNVQLPYLVAKHTIVHFLCQLVGN